MEFACIGSKELQKILIFQVQDILLNCYLEIDQILRTFSTAAIKEVQQPLFYLILQSRSRLSISSTCRGFLVSCLISRRVPTCQPEPVFRLCSGLEMSAGNVKRGVMEWINPSASQVPTFNIVSRVISIFKMAVRRRAWNTLQKYSTNRWAERP